MSQLHLVRNSSSSSLRALNIDLRLLEFWSRRYALDEQVIATLLTTLGIDLKYINELSLGNTVGTYTDWTHVTALGGYSIWKIAVSNFSDNDYNRFWIENRIGSENMMVPQLFEYQGQADSETESYLSYIYVYNGASYSSNYGGVAGDLSSDGGSYATILGSTSYYLYLGHGSTFSGMSFEHRVDGAGCTYVVEYWNGSAWTTMSVGTNNLADNTSNGTSDGKITFDIPGDWATTTVNGQSAYWIRISTSTTPAANPSCYQISPTDSVLSLLQRSSLQMLNEEWVWCFYNNLIYCTLPNAGRTKNEGVSWISSDSTSANKINFFVYYNTFKTRYLDSTWPAAVSGRSGSSTFNGTTGRVLTHSLGHQNYRILISPTADPGAGFYWYCTKADDTVTVYCNGSVSTAFDYRIEEY